MKPQQRKIKTQRSVNGRWSKAEHARFMLGLSKYGRKWVEVQKIVKTRTLVQIRSHAQKVILKMSSQDIQSVFGDQDSYQESDFCQSSQQSLTVQLEIQKNQNAYINITKPTLSLVDIFYKAIQQTKDFEQNTQQKIHGQSMKQILQDNTSQLQDNQNGQEHYEQKMLDKTEVYI